MEAKTQQDVCENCHRVIGSLETPMALNGHVVCFDCDALLRRQSNKVGGEAHADEAPAPSPEPTVAAKNHESCESCERAIGKRETPMVWKERVVCAQCYGRLEADAEREAEAERAAAIKATRLQAKAEAERVRAQLAARPISCPRCGSIQLSSGAKGFGGGKALTGLALLGPVGLFAGAMGSGKVKITCLKCGEVFAPGDTSEKLEADEKHKAVFVFILVLFIVLILLFITGSLSQ